MLNISFKNYNFIMSAAEFFIGILLLIDPVGLTSGILIAFGIIMIIISIWQIIKYFHTDAEEAAKQGDLAEGILLALIGIFCSFNSDWFINIFPKTTVIYGIFILIIGIVKTQIAVDMIRMKKSYWYVSFSNALVTLIFAVLIITGSLKITMVFWHFIGTVLILEAIADMVIFWFIRKFGRSD